MGLADFYHLIDEHQLAQPSPHDDDFTLFDDPVYQSTFVADEGNCRRTARVMFADITCYGCIWLIEKAIARRFEGCSISINLSTSAATLTYPKDIKLSDIAALSQTLGYKMQPATNTATQVDNRSHVMRLGVAFFVFLNVMVLASADYLAKAGDIEPIYDHIFRGIAFGLTSILVFYSATPFYTGAWQGIKGRRVNIDQPIVLSLLVAYGLSAFNTLRGTGPIYFDSAAAIVTLVLMGRYFQRLALQRADRYVAAQAEPKVEFTRVLRGDVYVITHTRDIHVGDTLKIAPGDVIPVTCILLSDAAEVSLESITGETTPLVVGKGDQLRSGSVNGSCVLLVRAEESGTASFLARSRATVNRLMTEKGQLADMSNRFASLFFYGIAVAGVAAFWLGHSTSTAEAVTRIMAVILIACPCAYGMAAPLVFSTCAAKATGAGVVFRTQHSVERLAAVRHIFFDKTGTLTEGSLRVKNWLWDDDGLARLGLTSQAAADLIASLAFESTHPHAQAVNSYVSTRRSEATLPDMTDVREEFGRGVVASSGSWNIRMGRRTFVRGPSATFEVTGSSLQTFVSINDQVVAGISMEDHEVNDASDVVTYLKRNRILMSMLTGDNQAEAVRIANRLGIDDITSELSPADKALLVRKPESAAMVGNGFNDMLAMASAPVSVAVRSSTDSTRKSADVILQSPGLAPLVSAIAISKRAITALKTALGFAVFYNIVGVTLAVFGRVTPLTAALLMPVSSLSIIYISTRWRPRPTGVA